MVSNLHMAFKPASRLVRSILGAACLALLLSAGVRAEPGAAAAPSPYVALYREIVAEHAAGKKTVPLAETLAVGEAAARLWRLTHETTYRDAAVRSFQAAFEHGPPDLRDFHPLLAFSQLAVLLSQEHLLPADLDRPVREIAVAQLKAFVQSTDDGDYNIRLAQVLSCVSLRQYLGPAPDPLCDAAGKRFDDYWAKIVATGDLDEDASNYDCFGAMLLVELARATGREDALRAPGFRRMFARFRDIVSPSGLIPEYGDSYFSYTDFTLDRLYLLEYAARLYHDPSFLAAARRMDKRPGLVRPPPDHWYRGQVLIDLPPCDLLPAPPSAPPSLVMYRARRGESKPLVDKLILRTGREPGAAMVMLDLYASGSHAHQEKGPSIAYYECDGVPLFHNMGRHQARSAIAGNLLWALPPDQDFPGAWRADRWFTMAIPVSYLERQADGCHIAPTLTLRNFHDRSNCEQLLFDNLRLEGPAGTLLVDDFEDPQRWVASLRKRTMVSLSTDHTQGKAAESVAWKAIPSGYVARNLTMRPPAAFQSADYHYLKWDLKYHGPRPYAHIRGLGRQVDLGDQLLEAPVEHAETQQRDRDACGRIRYASYVTPDTRATRSLVLTAEGCLAVLDVLTPGKRIDGWNAGPLWQLYQQRAAGEDWFCAADDGAYPQTTTRSNTRAMFVRFASDRPAQAGSVEVRQPYFCPTPNGRKPERFWTTFLRRPVQAGGPARFATLVVPQDPSQGTPDALASQVTVAIDAQGRLQGRVVQGDRVLTIALGNDTWDVQRSAK